MPIRLPSLVIALVAFLAAWPSCAHAEPLGQTRAAEPATLTFFNREIVVFRAVVLGYTPQQRVEAVRGRLNRIADEPGADEDVTVRRIEDGMLIEVRGSGVFGITPADVNTLAGESMESVTQRAVTNLRAALRASREQRDLVANAWAAGAVAVATAVFLLLSWSLARATRWLGPRMQAATVALVGHLRVGGHVAFSPEPIGKVVRQMLLLGGWVVGLFLTYLYLVFSLARFPYTHPWGEQLKEFLLNVLGTVARGIAAAIPGLVFVTVIILIARVLTRAVAVFTARVESGRITLSWLDADTAVPTRRILNAVLWLFALAMAYPYLPGAQSEAFKGLSVLVGLMITIGASGMVGQVASGLMIVYSRALRRGEYVRVGETEGTVAEVGLFATRVRTGLGEEVVLPNVYVVSNTTKNYSRIVAGGRGFVLDTTITIGYATPWRQVHAMLLEAARRSPGMMSEPAPFVVQTALSDFYVEYRLVAYAGPEQREKRAKVLDGLHANIQDVFNEYGVQIMSPHYMMDTPQPQVVPRENWHAAPAAPPPAPEESRTLTP